ncbi:MAG: hypothetical protein QM652_10600 [Legionella sp.]|uniref:hypothetical protein n=1 Tax=Legionella sp. TaxID=459 RepID=UPI0039E26D4B
MISFRYLVIFIFLLCTFSIHANSSNQQNKTFRSFWHPKYHGERLAYCTPDGKKCGKAIANHYCKMMGYQHVHQQVIAHNVGLTNYISTRARCKGWQCDGFMTISCITTLPHMPPKPYHYREQNFPDPRFNHYRVAWCYNRKQDCGSPAANAFCRHLGFMNAKHFVKENQVGATRTIGSEELCFGNECQAFKIIVCYR